MSREDIRFAYAVGNNFHPEKIIYIPRTSALFPARYGFGGRRAAPIRNYPSWNNVRNLAETVLREMVKKLRSCSEDFSGRE